MDPGAFLGNIIPLQFLDPVHVGRTHKHGVGVVPIAGSFRRGGTVTCGGIRRGGTAAAAGEERADHSSGQYGSADSICEFHFCFPPYKWFSLYNIRSLSAVGCKTDSIFNSIFQAQLIRLACTGLIEGRAVVDAGADDR